MVCASSLPFVSIRHTLMLACWAVIGGVVGAFITMLALIYASAILGSGVNHGHPLSNWIFEHCVVISVMCGAPLFGVLTPWTITKDKVDKLFVAAAVWMTIIVVALTVAK